MKKRFKTLIALGIVAVMVAGCSSPAVENDSQEKESQSVVQESEKTPAEGTEEESLYPEYLNLDSFRPIVKEGEDITLEIVVSRDSGTAKSDIQDSWFGKFIEQKLNIGLEIEEASGEAQAERKTLMLASNDLPDLICGMGITNSEVVKYGVEGGMLLPISDYFSEELTPNIMRLMEENPEAFQEATASDGKMYTLPYITASYPGFGSTVSFQRAFIDTKYLDAIGMSVDEIPETLDEFVDMLRAFKALDPAEMGVDEIWPLVKAWTFDARYFMNAFGWITDDFEFTSPCWDEATQSVEVPCLQEKFADYVRLYNTLYSEGLIHPDYYTMDDTAARALMAENKVPVMADGAPYLSLPERFADFVASKPLSTEWSETPVATMVASYGAGDVFVSADTEYPELCVRFMDYLLSPEGSLYSMNGCPADSEDTLGEIAGFTLGENNAREYAEVTAGEYDSYYDFQVNKICLQQDVYSDSGTAELYALELLGVEEPQFRELDLTNADDHYRYLVYEAQKDHLVPALPGLYMTEEQGVKYTDLKTVLDNYVNAEMAKFVVGQRPIEEVDKLVDELMAMGGEEYLELCKELYANYRR